MIKLLLVSATETEIKPALLFLEPYRVHATNSFRFGKLLIDACVTGVGMVNTAFELGKLSGGNFDLAINAGVAGAFDDVAVGTVIHVTEDCFAELGAEDGDDFLSIDSMGFGQQEIRLRNELDSFVTDRLPKARAITVNTVHGNEGSILAVLKRHQAGIESMEGAAFIHAANAFEWQAAQLRAVSNKVERRNRNNWDLPLAIKNLNQVLIELIKDLNGI